MFLIEGGIVMIANLVTILIMGMTFLYMMTKAQYAETRRVALIPLESVQWKCCCLVFIRAEGPL